MSHLNFIDWLKKLKYTSKTRITEDLYQDITFCTMQIDVFYYVLCK